MCDTPPVARPWSVRSRAWKRAATLAERVPARAKGRGQAGDEGGYDAERARRRLEQWRAQEPFASGSLFEQRLAQTGLTVPELLQLLAEPAEASAEAFADPPAWAAAIDAAFGTCHPDLPPYPDELRGRPETGFLDVIRPLVGQTVARLRERVRALEAKFSTPQTSTADRNGTSPFGSPFDPKRVAEILFAPLPHRLLALMSRTLLLELHVARLQGFLHGETPEERFRSFVDRLGDPDVALEILREYPVLARQVVTCLDNWLAASLEFLQRWCADWPVIRNTFSADEDPGPLVALRADAGDSHRGGRSVVIAGCRSGFRVVYKPKSLAVDGHFQELLGWLNERGARPPFRPIKVLDRGDYGWEEFVSPGGCASAGEMDAFYRREGGYLAVLYALAATDFHYENVIAAGEHPVLIDLEALFRPRAESQQPLPADHLAGYSLDESVLGSGLLPQPARLDFDSKAFDLSGMAAEPGRALPWRYPGFAGHGTDEMHFTRLEDVLALSDHRPSLDGVPADPLDHKTAIEAGFRQVYDLLRRHREELLAAGGPLDAFASDEVRVLLRPTSLYGELLAEGSHPDVLRDALDRDRLFDRLWQGVEEWPALARTIPAEVEDLWRGEVPYFSTRPGSHDLVGSAGQCFREEFEETGLDRVRRRLARFGDADLARQVWFLRASLTTLTTEADPAVQPGYRLVENGRAADPERLLAASRAVGDWLAEHAVHGPGGDVNWVGLTLVRDEQWSLLPLGTDLYDGVPGVTLFLAYLAAITGAERYTSLARAALKTLQRRLLPRKRLKTIRCLGGFTGWGGVLYTLAHLGALWEEPAILAEAQELVTLLPDLVEQDKYFDVGLGAAGCIAGLLCLDRVAPSPQLRAVAIKCGDHLLARARPMPQGVGWDWPFPSRGPLTGYAHGAAGIALALLELADFSGEERFRAAARRAIDYERSLFSAEAGNWPDLRLFGTAPEQAAGTPHRYSVAWCYGAAGIGLARLGCRRHLDDARLQPELDTALRTTRAKGFGFSHILCHGDLGNLELLLQAGRSCPASPWRVEADRLAAGILTSIDRDGWRCANPMRLESPGLMTGLSGIGYQLLRLAEPEKVPSVLTLAPTPLTHRCAAAPPAR